MTKKNPYNRELRLIDTQEVKSDDDGHGDHGHGGHDDHGHGGGHGHDDHGHGGGHGHDDHGHGGGHGGHDDHGHGGHDDHGHGGGHGHDHTPKSVKVPADKWEDYVENILFFAAGVFHNISHLIIGTLAGATITRTVLWHLNSEESDMKGGAISKFFFGLAPYFLLIVSYYLYKAAMQSYGADVAIYYYLAFCAGFAAKPSGRDYKYMQEANNSAIGIIAQPINMFTKLYKQVFYGLTGNMAIGIAMFLIALYF